MNWATTRAQAEANGCSRASRSAIIDREDAMLKDIRLETDRLIIMPFKIQDIEVVHQMLSDEEVMRYLPDGIMSLEKSKETLDWLIRCYDKNTPERIVKLTLAVVRKKDEKIVGWCGLGPLGFAPEEIEIYYGLLPDFWNQGITTEASKTVLDFAFRATKLDRIVAIVRPENGASIRVIEKMGLVYQKTLESLPEKYRWFDGCLYYSISREDYYRKKPISKEAL
jgi:ribosomal-protein-alanine N-acetyltransferase